MPAEEKPFFRETQVWRLIGLAAAVLGLFAPDSIAFEGYGVMIKYPTIFIVVGLGTFASPTIMEAIRKWRGSR